MPSEWTHINHVSPLALFLFCLVPMSNHELKVELGSESTCHNSFSATKHMHSKALLLPHLSHCVYMCLGIQTYRRTIGYTHISPLQLLSSNSANALFKQHFCI